MSFQVFPVVFAWLGLFVCAQPNQPVPNQAASRPSASQPTASQPGRGLPNQPVRPTSRPARPPVPPGDPKATELLEQSQQALRALSAIAYDGDYVAEGIAASVLPSRKGHVVLTRNNSRFLRIRASEWAPAPDGRLVLAAEMISDGTVVASINHDRQLYREFTGPGAAGEILRWHGIVIEQLLRGELYKNEIAHGTANFKGSEVVDGIDCHIIEAPHPEASVVVRWWIAKKDLLPRRVVRIISGEIGEGRSDLRLNSLDPDPAVSAELFVFAKPEGYSDQGPSVGPRAVPSPLEARFLPVGSEAPDWTLRSVDGTQVALKDLRGKVVFLSFWASWAPPCVNALPSIQKVCEAYKDRPFAAYVINCYEYRPNPAQALPAGLSQALLLRGDEVAKAYSAQGIPTFYVISPEGKVLFVEGGVLHENSVKAAIDKALQSLTQAQPAATPAAP
ncbi:MAG: redoxin domain-containing protein [Phycisphaerae bacterium]|nr:redoxin domain-containing protein [Phycisphaerae bacterium]